MPTLTYEQARGLVGEGDLIGVRGKDGLIPALTRFFTRDVYTHTGIVRWMDGEPWLTELNSGRNHAIPLDQLEDEDFDVCLPPVPDRSKIRESGWLWLRRRVSYSYLAFVTIGLLSFFRLKLFIHWRKELVCDGYSIGQY